MPVGDSVDYILKKYLMRFALADKFHISVAGGDKPCRVVEHLFQALLTDGLGYVIKGVTAESLRHEIRAGGQKDKKTFRVCLPQRPCNCDSINVRHIYIKEDYGKSTGGGSING